ncbi:MAG: alanine racemase [Ghiorsea sp.]
MRTATLTINISHLLWNYRLLQQHSPRASIMAVVKANAYGHGLIPVSSALYQEGCRNFAVTDTKEGISLREHLNPDATITVFSGIFDMDDASACKTHTLTPVLTNTDQLELLKNCGFTGNIWLKVDTGMNRLGCLDIQAFNESLSHQPHIQLAGIMSHMACADTPENPLNQKQISDFQTMSAQANVSAYSLFNSAGSLAFGDTIPTDVIRPGIALYGIEPVAGKNYGFKPVAELSSRVIQARQIKRGESVSYDASWIAQEDTNIAVVALGYADGLPRLLSNQGVVWCKGEQLPIIGKVCMDYCMLDISYLDISVGEKVVFFGPNPEQPHVQQLATLCETIPYEIFTSLNSRLNYQYIGEKL